MTQAADPDARTPKQRRQRSDAALNYSGILEAARTLLREDPGASMSDIAAAAGVGRGTAYRHFPSREKLMEVVRRQARDDHAENEEDSLRPAGEVANITPSPLSVPDILNKVPPFQLGVQIVAEALRLGGVSSAALYVVDLDGSAMLRLAGSASFPASFPVPLAIGPEIPREGIAPLRAAIEAELPDVTLAPMFLRGRAIGLLLALGTGPDDALRELAHEAAVAIALSPLYTDYTDTVRRTRDTSPAAELQQTLLPPRIVRIGGAMLAGNVIPAYDVGGDWFDYAQNPGGTWLGIADTDGSGTRAAGMSAVLLGAFRSARHRDGADPTTAVQLMHEVLTEVTAGSTTASTTIGFWNPPSGTLRWVSAGPLSPLLVARDGTVQSLGGTHPRLGTRDFPTSLTLHSRRIRPGERVIFASDGVLDRARADGGRFGLEGLQAAVMKASDGSAAATLRAIEDATHEAASDALTDDATLIVLAPTTAPDTP